jgi:hypothetical protein
VTGDGAMDERRGLVGLTAACPRLVEK